MKSFLFNCLYISLAVLLVLFTILLTPIWLLASCLNVKNIENFADWVFSTIENFLDWVEKL